MHRRDFITSGIAATGAVAMGLEPSHPSAAVHFHKQGDFRDFFVNRTNANDGVQIEWLEHGRRVFYVDLGSMPAEKAQSYLFEIATDHGLTIMERV